MKILTAKGLQHAPLDRTIRRWVYNLLDCCVPHDIFDTLHPLLSPLTAKTYAFERACQAPAFAMMCRGVRVDVKARGEAIAQCKRDLKVQERAVNKLPEVRGVWDGWELETGLCRKSTRKDGRHKWPKGVPDKERQCECCGRERVKNQPFNPNSHHQTWHLLYDLHGLAKQKNKKHEYSVDEEVLERIGRKWSQFKTLTDVIREARGGAKQLGFLNSKLSPNGRMMSSFNVGAPDTGRWSSSKNPYRIGTNLQNIAEKNRYIFVADPGKDMFYADLEQAESRAVAYLAGDEAYIKAHDSGNVHVYVARKIWPDMDWNGDQSHDKALCKETPLPWDADHTIYDQSKRNQHALNYYLTPHGLAMQTHQPLDEAKRVYELYFGEFERIKPWQNEIIAEVKMTGVLTTPVGRRRQFFGRLRGRDQDILHTLRQGIAFKPQSIVADILNTALWLVWKDLDPWTVWLLAQVHDAILGEVERGDVDALRAVRDRMTLPVEINGRIMTIPVEIAVGRNWGHWDGTKNPMGIKEVEL